MSVNPPLLMDIVLKEKQMVYLWVVILIVGILCFGTFVTWRVVRKEMELVKLKSDFTYSVSHEFKSPLAVIKQFSELLQDDRIFPEERRNKYFQIIGEECNRLSDMIDSVLEFAKIEEGRKVYETEQMDVKEVIEEILFYCRKKYLDQGIIIKSDIPDGIPHIETDRTAFISSLLNLIDNAVKYSNGAAVVDVIVLYDSRHLWISVKDYGLGIDKNEITKIFEKYYRSNHSHIKQIRGTGLGLYLVQDYVEAFGGEITVDSVPGNGSTFTIKLPLNHINQL